MYKDLIVATTGQGDDAAAFEAACALVAEGGGHVAVLVQVSVPIPDGGGMGLFPAGAFVALYEEVHQQGEAARDRWKAALARAGVPGEVRLVDDVLSSPPQTATSQARYADMALIGLGRQGELPVAVHDQLAKMLTGSGRPVLAVPQGARPPPYRRILLGWRAGPNAARAVHDALPMLSRAELVDVLCIDPDRNDSGPGGDPGTDIATHLARHGIAAAVHVEVSGGDEPGALLLRRARALGSDLLVMGGYGHSRLREWALGGTTRYVLTNAALPVFLSH